MFQRQYLIGVLAVASCLVLVAQANEDVKVSTTSTSSASATASSSSTNLITSTGNNNGASTAAASAALATDKGSLIVPPGGESSGAKAAAAAAASSAILDNALQEKLTSKLPTAAVEAVNEQLTQVVKGEHHQSASITVKPLVGDGPSAASGGGGPVKPDERLNQYFEQVCGAVNKLSQKQLFKLQSQLKQFVERTAGKMSLCFMTHYNMDPNLSPATVENLSTICSSRSLAAEVKGSFKQFQACSSSNWDVSLDKELERIIAARKNHAKSHDHIKESEASSGLSSLTHDHQEDDDEDLVMIGDVVKKVLDGNKDVANKPGINVIDISGPAVAAAVANNNNKIHQQHQTEATKSSGTTSSPLASLLAPNKKDSNTVVVFVDDSKQSPASTIAPEKISTTGKPSLELEMPGDLKLKVNLAASTASPTTTTPTTTTTIAPAPVKLTVGGGGEQVHLQETSTNSEHSNKANVSLSSIVTAALDVKTTPSPIDGAHKEPSSTATSTPAPTVTSNSTSAKPAAAANITVISVTQGGADKGVTTVKPKQVETLQEMLKRQEKEKVELEAKLKVEREKIMKELQKKQDEIDAKNAIKSLQMQRATGGHAAGHADAQLHQWEHERQMSIDPVGHTIKHQQYEMNKQKKTMSFTSIKRVV